MRARLIAVGIFVTALCACSGTAPTAPSKTAPIVSLPSTTSILQVAVTGDEWVLIGSASVQLTAKLITNLNPIESLPANTGIVWSADPSGIVSVDQRGVVTGVQAGIATISARYGDKIGSLKIRSIPNFTGRWSGHYDVINCTGGSDFRTCSYVRLGINQPLTLELSQDHDHVSGIDSPSSTRPILLTGAIALSGDLTLHGSSDQSASGLGPLTVDYSLTSVSPGAMTGFFNWGTPTKTDFGYPGLPLLVETKVRDMTRTP